MNGGLAKGACESKSEWHTARPRLTSCFSSHMLASRGQHLGEGGKGGGGRGRADMWCSRELRRGVKLRGGLKGAAAKTMTLLLLSYR